MNFRIYFNKNKQAMFPEIKDWTSEQNHIRHETDVRKLSWREWFFLHPTAFNLINFSISVSAFITFTVLALLALLIWKLIIVAVICIFFALTQTVGLGKKIRQYHINKNFTFYDLWMKE